MDKGNGNTDIYFENAFEFFGDSGQLNCPPEIDPRGDPLKVTLRQESDFVWACADFIDSNYHPDEVVRLLHTFSPRSDVLPVPTTLQTAEALSDLLSDLSIFRKSLDFETAEIIEFVANLPNFRRMIKEFSAWLVQEDQTTDVYNDIPLIDASETSASHTELIGGVRRAEAVDILSNTWVEVSGETTILAKAMTNFLVEHPEYVRSLNGRLFSNSDTLWRQFTRLGKNRRAAVLGAFTDSLDPVDQQSISESLSTKTLQSFASFSDNLGKSYLVHKDRGIAPPAISDTENVYQVIGTNPDTKPPTYRVVRTAYHPVPTLRPALCERGLGDSQGSRGSALLGWATLSLIERYSSEDSQMALKRREDFQPQVRAARHIALSVFFRVWEADIHAASLTQRTVDYLEQNLD